MTSLLKETFDLSNFQQWASRRTSKAPSIVLAPQQLTKGHLYRLRRSRNPRVEQRNARPNERRGTRLSIITAPSLLGRAKVSISPTRQYLKMQTDVASFDKFKTGHGLRMHHAKYFSIIFLIDRIQLALICAIFSILPSIDINIIS